MASPKLEVFFIFDQATGLPLEGQTCTFATYKDHLGNDLPQPVIAEIGGGSYGFEPTFADLNKGIVYMVDTDGANPLYVMRYMRPEDWNADNADTTSSSIMTMVDLLRVLQTGKWEIFTTGPNANHLILYDDDGITEVWKWALFDDTGSPTYTNFYSRVPDMPPT